MFSVGIWAKFPFRLLCTTVGFYPALAPGSTDVESGASSAGAKPLIQSPFVVVGAKERWPLVGGSIAVLGEEALAASRVFTANEALRRIPGLAVRDEEGFGLRPNIGLRGLNPTRSTKVTLLEDGMPLAYAPYGDNSSYYHPPIERFAGLEVLKGATALGFGPQTIGGVINYLTPETPQAPGGFVQAVAGNRGYFYGHVRIGGHGALLDYVRKSGDGARDHLAHRIEDLNLKYVARLGNRHSVTLRTNRYSENSLVTYSGLTQAEFERLGARYNPFRHDTFAIARDGASMTHELRLADGTALRTNAYYSSLDRDWWRQSSSSQDGQHGAGAIVYTIDGITATFLQHRLAGRRVDAATQFPSAQGRLRSYVTWGLEPRVSRANSAGELQAGLKYHREDQDRRQINANSPTGRTGAVAEDNLRETRAWSAFLAQRVDFGAVALTPIVRYEAMRSARLDRLRGVAGASSLARFLPGLGATWQPDAATTLFASIHRGFAPPRVEDLIDGDGTATDVEAEDSVNLEAGVRRRLRPGWGVQASVFRHEFGNLIAVGSIAGGGTPLAQGRARFAGLELGMQAQSDDGFRARLAYTWLGTAEQTAPFLSVATKGALPGSVAGHRQPYAPEHLLTAALAWSAGDFGLELEAQHTGRQFSDFANTVAPSPDGQRGTIPGATIWNAAVHHRTSTRISLFATMKNVGDRTVVTDRTRGVLVGMPRLLQAGVRYAF